MQSGAAREDPPAVPAQDAIWSLEPLRKSGLPQTTIKGWAKSPVDTFILAKLEEKKMRPARRAEKRDLLRRVTFDLIGLPPTPAEMRDFLNDRSPDAFAAVVDRLLASPRYGERWARHWLDTVHYADSHGHDQDRPRPNAWPYRDYVIRSFNDDKPYARFVHEQIAGDILFPNDPNGIVATGFIVTGPWDLSSLMAIMEDTVDKKIARYLDRDDMVMTTMSTFVSTTAHCARCHDHKFDPIPQREYYNLQSIFAGVDRADRPFDLDPQTNARRQALLRKKTALEVKDQHLIASLLTPEIQAGIAAWETTMASERIWTVLDPASFTASSSAVLTKQNDSSLLVSGESPKIDTYTITANTDLTNITAIRLEVLTDSSHPRNGPGRQPENGNFHLSEFKAIIAPKREPAKGQPVALQNPTADFNQEGWSIDKAIDGDTNTAWGIFPETGKPHHAVFELKEDAGFEEGSTFTFVLQQLHGREHTILRPRLSLTTARRPVKAEPLPKDIRDILATEPAARTNEQKTDLAVYYLKQQIDKDLTALPSPQLVYAAANDFAPKGNFVPARTPRPVNVLKRGDVNKPGDAAVPGALSCVRDLPAIFELPSDTDEGARRAALARWLVDPKNVLAWRSIVNRIWHYHFGRGIVETLNDFGHMGARPSHPELLDWLAIWFQEHGGSIKELHRLILNSSVYQQSCRNDSRFAELDGDNRLLWRMNRTRLDAESIRDAVLQITGKLDLTMGGPPVKQFHFEDPNPENTPVVDYSRFDVDNPASFRRSIYRFLFRTLPDPFLDTLDCADASQLTPVRNVSITALQALALWNDAFMLRQSEHFAARLASAGTIPQQLKLAFELALGRPPTSNESRDLAAYAAKHGMASACRLIFNSNEFIFLN